MESRDSENAKSAVYTTNSVCTDILCRDPDINTIRVQQLRRDDKIITLLSLVEFFSPRPGIVCLPQVQVNATGGTERAYDAVGICGI